MKPILFVFLFITTSVIAQINYQEGYFITEDNKKISCLIKNEDWIKSPVNFRYKLTQSDEVKTSTISDVIEFAILNTDIYYVRHQLSEDLNTPIVDKLVFLKVLIKGDGSLLEYVNKSSYFFYQLNDNRLMYLSVPTKKDKSKNVKASNLFRKELYKNLDCETFTVSTYNNLKYSRSDLTKLFLDYNSCKGSNSDNIYDNRYKAYLKFKVFGGINLHSSVSNTYAYDFGYNLPPSGGSGTVDVTNSGTTIEFGQQTNYSIGAEIEVFLGLNRNKWSVFTSPNYQSMSNLSGSKRIDYYSFNYVVDVSSVSFIELPLGVRYYMNINEKTKIFTHLAYSNNVIVSSDYSQELEGASNNFEGKLASNTKNFNAYIGVGLNYDKFALGVNYYFEKNMRLGSHVNINAKNTISFFGTYTLF
ncbi:hypothetical protein [Winogradskyella thalassocola]|uniref:Outer membrane protein beta-barrel domain-containing protein n=1 Tax=Winogradskyella thalassocola TaxID=262004 RepID=A0A1G8I694_9FLAO|nr:hypothetical protein [Winogradskyella thalassocola]SDI14342.1 hypothetical protein SAMN04489796_107145 [Winogradskyella thalassocola]